MACCQEKTHVTLVGIIIRWVYHSTELAHSDIDQKGQGYSHSQ